MEEQATVIKQLQERLQLKLNEIDSEKQKT